MGKKRKKRCLAFLMALAMMTGLFMGDAAGLLVKAEDTPASVQIGITTLETGWYFVLQKQHSYVQKVF